MFSGLAASPGPARSKDRSTLTPSGRWPKPRPSSSEAALRSSWLDAGREPAGKAEHLLLLGFAGSRDQGRTLALLVQLSRQRRHKQPPALRPMPHRTKWWRGGRRGHLSCRTPARQWVLAVSAKARVGLLAREPGQPCRAARRGRHALGPALPASPADGAQALGVAAWAGSRQVRARAWRHPRSRRPRPSCRACDVAPTVVSARLLGWKWWSLPAP